MRCCWKIWSCKIFLNLFDSAIFKLKNTEFVNIYRIDEFIWKSQALANALRLSASVMSIHHAARVWSFLFLIHVLYLTSIIRTYFFLSLQARLFAEEMLASSLVHLDRQYSYDAAFDRCAIEKFQERTTRCYQLILQCQSSTLRLFDEIWWNLMKFDEIWV